MFLSALLYLAAAVFLGGMSWRILNWARTPAPLNISLTPGPKSAAGVAGRLAGEIFLFRSLREADGWLWAVAWLFHLALLLLFIGHFAGLVVPHRAEAVLGLDEAAFEKLAQVAGSFAGLLALGTLCALLVRRLAAERPRHISTFSDFLALGILLLVIGTGNQMRFLGGVELEQARQFAGGWLRFHPVAAPAGGLFAVHVLSVSGLLLYAPFSKLVHLGGAALFNPALNLPNNTRSRRHLGQPGAWTTGQGALK